MDTPAKKVAAAGASGKQNPVQNNQEGDFPQWAPIAGFVLLAVTIAFLMALIFFKISVECDQRGLIVFLLALTTGGAAAFLGGNAKASGAIPFLKETRPLTVAVTGGVGVVVVVMILGFQLYADDSKCGGASAATAVYEGQCRFLMFESQGEGDLALTVDLDGAALRTTAGELDRLTAVLKGYDDGEQLLLHIKFAPPAENQMGLLRTLTFTIVRDAYHYKVVRRESDDSLHVVASTDKAFERHQARWDVPLIPCSNYEPNVTWVRTSRVRG